MASIQDIRDQVAMGNAALEGIRGDLLRLEEIIASGNANGGLTEAETQEAFELVSSMVAGFQALDAERQPAQ